MQEERDYGSHAFFRGIILLGFFILIFRLLLSGDIRYYIAPKMIPFSYIALGILLILGVMQLWRSSSDNPDELYCNCGFNHARTGSPIQTFFIYTLFVLPVLTGLWFPHTVLDSSVVVNRGIQYGTGLYAMPSETIDDEDPIEKVDSKGYDEEIEAYLAEINTLKSELLSSEKMIVDDEHYLDAMYFLNESPDLYIGKEIELVGFVYKEHDFEHNQFVIARFGISCCVADAVVYGLLSTSDEAQNLREDQWVRASGHLSKKVFHNLEIPYLVITELEEIEQPEHPYVY